MSPEKEEILYAYVTFESMEGHFKLMRVYKDNQMMKKMKEMMQDSEEISKTKQKL